MSFAHSGLQSLIGLVNLCFDRRRDGRLRGGGQMAVVDAAALRIFQGVVVDESATGCRVALGRVTNTLRQGSTVDCHARPSQRGPLGCRRGKVVWARKVRLPDGKFETHLGVQFTGATAMRLAA